jgi:opacity protein-like surface antigen
VSYGRNLRITLALCVAALFAAFAPSAQAAVCNEASNGQRGNLVVTGSIHDPSIPARHTTDLKPLGNGVGKGLQTAAERSPALSQCGLPSNGLPAGIDLPLGGAV